MSEEDREAFTDDPADDRTLECAVVAGATYIATGDRRHLLFPRDYQGISIVSAADFLVKFAGSWSRFVKHVSWGG